MTHAEVLTEDDCLEIARRHFGTANHLKVVHWDVQRLGEGHAGFLGEHFRAEVEILNGSSALPVKVSVFVKTLPPNEKHKALIRKNGAFRKEAAFYSEILAEWERRGLVPASSAVQRPAGDDQADDSWNCRWYIARDDMIAMENLAPLGYVAFEARQTLDYDQSVLVAKMLANYHAASLIYEEEKSAELGREFRMGKDHPEVSFETFYVNRSDHPGLCFTETGIRALLECAKLLPVCSDAATWRQVEEKLPLVLRRMYELVGASKLHRNVLCHGDLWQNNVLFSTGKSVKLVDFQLLRYAPPAHDIFDFLYLSTRRDFRRRHEKALLEEYWVALSAALRRRGLDVEIVLPRSDFDDSLPEQKLAGRLSGVYTLHWVVSSSKAVERVFGDEVEYDRMVYTGEGRIEFVCGQFLSDEGYRERLGEALEELIEHHVLSRAEA